MRYICCLLIFFNVYAAHTQDTLKLSIKDALEQTEARAALKNARLSRELALRQLSEAYIQLFPDIEASADVKDYLRRPTSIIPGEFLGRPGTRVPIQFNTKYSIESGVTLTQPVIDLEAIRGLKVARINTQIADVTLQDSISILRMTAVQDYLNILILQEQIEQQNSTVKRYEEVAAYTKTRYASGLSPEVDLKRSEADLENAAAEKQKLISQLRLSELLLKFHSGLDLATPLVLTDRAATDTVISSGEVVLTDLPRYRRQSLFLKQNYAELNRLRTAAYPTLSAYGFIGYQAFGNQFRPWENQIMPWYPVSYLGVKLKWKISAVYTNRFSTTRFRVGIRQQENILNELDKQLQYDVTKAETSFENSVTDLKIAVRNREVMRATREYVFERYKLGLASLRELAESEDDYVRSMNQYFISLLNANLTRYEYMQVTGRL
jgi:outer membrane protein